jgi:hypothetical protein
MSHLTLGLLSAAEHEDHRLPLDPQSLLTIDHQLRERIVVQTGVTDPFGVRDVDLAHAGLTVGSREELIERCDVLLTVEASAKFVQSMKSGQLLWAWLDGEDHVRSTVQERADNLAVVDCAAMYHWGVDGSFVAPVFSLNDELAGYASVVHAMTLQGTTGTLGPQLTAAVLGLGQTAKGAINALQALGILDITVVTKPTSRPTRSFAGLTFEQLISRDDDPSRCLIETSQGRICVAEFLGGFDVVVNAMGHDPEKPLVFADDEEVGYFPPGRLIVDVHPRRDIAFTCAERRPFSDPAKPVGNGTTYFAGNSSQAMFWKSATWAMNQALTPYLEPVLSGPEVWAADLTLQRALFPSMS